MKKKYYVGISLLVAFLIIVIDQVTKWIIASSMKIGDSYEVIPNFLNITSHRNNGAAWGILSGKMFFFYIITVIILIVLVLFFIKEAQYNLFTQGVSSAASDVYKRQLLRYLKIQQIKVRRSDYGNV